VKNREKMRARRPRSQVSSSARHHFLRSCNYNSLLLVIIELFSDLYATTRYDERVNRANHLGLCPVATSQGEFF
ncbi:MAG: hypothetical protein JXA30_15615, partial [Deltaproteobacteria bacterium]|nr:hypothetical protein [Deltaproteobacteria bacterium]